MRRWLRGWSRRVAAASVMVDVFVCSRSVLWQSWERRTRRSMRRWLRGWSRRVAAASVMVNVFVCSRSVLWQSWERRTRRSMRRWLRGWSRRVAAASVMVDVFVCSRSVLWQSWERRTRLSMRRWLRGWSRRVAARRGSWRSSMRRSARGFSVRGRTDRPPSWPHAQTSRRNNSQPWVKYMDIFITHSSREVAFQWIFHLQYLWNTGKLGYDGLNRIRKISLSYAKSVIYIWHILDMHGTRTKHIVRHRRKSVVQWSVLSKFACMILLKRYHQMNQDSLLVYYNTACMW